MHGNYATVFANLFIGERDYGPHAFLVMVRDKNGTLQDNIIVEDMGEKEGLNGVLIAEC